MTPAQRETLTKLAERYGRWEMNHADEPWAAELRKDIAALRAALVERTCGTCKMRNQWTGGCYRDVQDPDGEEVKNTRSAWYWRNRETFGCSEWQAREGEG